MRLGIVSDTHDDLAAIEAAVDLFESRDVDTVVHCGDFVAPFSVTPFDADFDFHAVRGNNDGEWAVESTVESFGSYHGEAGTLTLDRGDPDRDPTEVAVVHGTSAVVVDALVGCGEYDYVFHGHTHAHGVEARDGTVRVNPGGLPIPVDGADDTFRVATLDTADRGVDAVSHHRLHV